MQATPFTLWVRKNFSKKVSFLIFFLSVISSSLHSQLAVLKMVGKNSKNSQIGYGLFAFWDFPVNDIGNRSVMLELLDVAYFPQKHSDVESIIGYLSIRAGFKYIFSAETKTGLYVEPSVGWCRVISSEETDDGDVIHGDGIALAAEAGYTVEVGQKGNNLNFGLKYETDRAGNKTTVSSIAFRFSYSFHMFRKRGN